MERDRWREREMERGGEMEAKGGREREWGREMGERDSERERGSERWRETEMERGGEIDGKGEREREREGGRKIYYLWSYVKSINSLTLHVCPVKEEGDKVCLRKLKPFLP